jgi:hypothetical protein
LVVAESWNILREGLFSAALGLAGLWTFGFVAAFIDEALGLMTRVGETIY